MRAPFRVLTLLLCAVLVPAAVNLAATLLNVRALVPRLPQELADTFDAATYANSQEYARASARADVVESLTGLAILLGFWLGGGFGWLDGRVRGLGLAEVPTGLVAIGVLYVGQMLLGLPFAIYDTFVLEKRFGFNQTTVGTFVADRLKGLALTAVLGLPVLGLLLWFFENIPHAWLWSWGALSVISLGLSWLAPRFLFPLFNKFTPLPEGELRTAINDLSVRCEFPCGEISVVDGSRRSTKANAFFAGWGRHKRIALYDTLVANHPVPELVSVLAHEIGHFKKKHIIQGMVLGVLETGAMFFLLSLVMKNAELSEAFGVGRPSVWFSLVSFSVLYRPVSLVLSLLGLGLSRRNEFEADAYAAEVTGSVRPMMAALKKLAKDSLSNLTPHPFYVFLHYSHPPMVERLRALGGLEFTGKPGQGAP